MGYEGVKFRTEKKSKDVPNDSRLKELQYWCTVFHEKNLAPPYEGGSYGNLSFRVRKEEKEFIITASQSGLGESITNNRFVTVHEIDLDKGIVYFSGLRNPSSEAMVHYAILDIRKDVQAIFHGHCKNISKNAERLNIPITKKEQPYGTRRLVEEVLEIISNHNFVEMKNHGFISLGNSLNEAGNLALKYLESTKDL